MHCRLLFLPFAAALLTGCATLPDTQSFTDATISLRRAVASSGSAVVAEMKSVPLPAANAQATRLATAWTARNRAMSALVEYANSLQTISDAGNHGADSAQKLADAAGKLTQTLGAASFGASAAANLATETFAFASSQIARARAARSLEASLAEIQPAIDRLATLFAADLTALDEAVTLALRAQRDALEDANQSEIGYRRQLLATQRELMSGIRSALGSNQRLANVTATAELDRVTQLLA